MPALLDKIFPSRSIPKHVKEGIKAQKGRALFTLGDLATQAQSYADMLVYGMKAAPDVVATRDLAFTRTYRYHGKDLTAAAVHTRNALCERLNRLFRDYHDGWMFSFDLDRRRTTYYPESTFIDIPSWLVDEERRERFTSGRHYISDTYVTVTYAPPRNAALKARSWIYSSDSKKRHQAMDATFGRKLFDEGCERLVKALEQDFTIAPLTLRAVSLPGEGPVVMDDQLGFFVACTTGKRQDVRAIPNHCDVSEYVANETVINNDRTLRIGDCLVRPLTVVDFADYHLPSVLDFLDQIPGSFRVNWRYIAREKDRALKDIKGIRGRNLQKRHGPMDTVVKSQNALTDGDAVRMQYDTEDVLDALKSGNVHIGFFSLNIVFYENIKPQLVSDKGRMRRETREEAEERTRQEQDDLVNRVAGALQTRGFVTDQNLGNWYEAFLGTLPAHGHYNVVKAQLATRPLANFIPTTTVWQGSPFCSDPQYPHDAPCLAVFATNGNTPFYFDPSHKDRGGHTLIIGETGTGKSALAGLFLNQHRRYNGFPRGAQQIVIDRDFSHEVQCAAVGGTNNLVGPGTDIGFAPFRHIDEPEEFEWAEAFAAVLVRQQGLNPQDYGEEIYTALCSLREAPPDQRTMSDMAAAYGLSAKLQKIFRHYATGGSAGSLFDAKASEFGGSDFTVFEVSPLLEESHLHLPGMLALLHAIERKCDKGVPTILVTEELWALLEDDAAARVVKKWLKTMRKRNVWVFLVTQSLEDIEKTPIASTIIGSCTTKIILPHESLMTDENLRRLKSLQLAEWEVEALAALAGQHAFYVMKPEGRRMVASPLDPVGRCTVAVSNKTERPKAYGYMRAFGDDWYPEWVLENAGELWRRHAYYGPQLPVEETWVPQPPVHAKPHPRDPVGKPLSADDIRQLQEAPFGQQPVAIEEGAV